MDLPPRQRVAIDRLLLQREEQFVRVHACETAIEAILGGAYPFPPPPPLPSRQKRTRARKKSKQQKAATTPPSRVPLPSLRPGEVAYRLVYRDRDRESSEEYSEADALNRWLARPRQSVRVLLVATVDANGQIVRSIFDDTAE